MLTVEEQRDKCLRDSGADNDVKLPPSKRVEAHKNALECLNELRSNYQTELLVNRALEARRPVGSGAPEAYLAPAPAGATVTPSDVATLAAAAGDQATKLSTSQNQQNFLGFSWGAGAGYAFGQGPRRVTASVVNGVVRVSSDVTDGPRVFLEAHVFPEALAPNSGTRGLGPFAVVEAGSSSGTSSSALTGFGLGVMYGWQTDAKSSAGFSVGVGYIWEGGVQTLGDGIVANQPLPKGETQVRYTNQSAGAIMIMLSRQFGAPAAKPSS
jgi:hypothetical protein